MFEAQYLFTGDEVYSPWMARGGDNVIITVDLISRTGSAALTISLFDKNSETPGDGGVVSGGNLTSGGPGTREDKEYNGVLEMVRYKIVAGGSGDRILFRMLSPVWFDDVAV